MKKIAGLILTLAMLSTILVKKQRSYEYGESVIVTESAAASNSVPPLLLATSLHDSVPDYLLTQNGLPDVSGIKLKFHTGNFASHFRYNVPAERVLRTLALLPVSFASTRADTTCRAMQLEELNDFIANLSTGEYEQFPDFVQASSSGFDAYECLKPPFRHIVLISRNDNTVLHRVDRAG